MNERTLKEYRLEWEDFNIYAKHILNKNIKEIEEEDIILYSEVLELMGFSKRSIRTKLTRIRNIMNEQRS
ncbi:hypothetical protein [Clostridium perfringens]|uniref:hypothetical protein n=1 Tax=Clostridium perfringens TaxID=1502 RepID=UPI001A28B595|nr:hypothetical protein [Clostridium perfringens]EJT6665590.1 hypothetical protein [Clostridium perfringens]MCX0408574.1 hypothetical protein [Clostridium perfringens]MDM0578875.1 hypothetical protein [Clostridium perfringens]HAT4331391.1 hypothetical protein [Clostridium perfringens]HBI7045656.1 hypothetical protein [Clostridium perfringens]